MKIEFDFCQNFIFLVFFQLLMLKYANFRFEIRHFGGFLNFPAWIFKIFWKITIFRFAETSCLIWSWQNIQKFHFQENKMRNWFTYSIVNPECFHFSPYEFFIRENEQNLFVEQNLLLKTCVEFQNENFHILAWKFDKMSKTMKHLTKNEAY